jgi:hypothetical protein
MTGLRALALARTQTTGEGAYHLRNLVNLESLALEGDFDAPGNRGQFGLLYLKKLTRMRRLTVCKAEVTDPELVGLLGMKDLTDLNLLGGAITDRGMAHLANLERLRVLTVQSSPITNKGVQHLIKLRHLRFLDLDDTTLDDDAIPALQKLEKLESLKIDGTSLSEAGIAKLKRSMPDLDVAP